MRISWDDLQTVEVLVRVGTVAGAAKELSLRHSTVSRRIDAIEKALEEPLFLRGARLRPTHLAMQIAEHAATMADKARVIDTLVRAAGRQRQARLVVSTNDVLAPMLLQAIARMPDEGGRVQLKVTDEEVELAPGVMDLALRPGSQPRAALRGWRLGKLRVGIYQAASLPADQDAWVLPSPSLSARSSMRWWKAIPRQAQGRIECNSLLAMRDACQQGLGRTVLPAVLAHEDARLVQVEKGPPGPAVWLLSSATRHGDKALRASALSLVDTLRALPGIWAA